MSHFLNKKKNKSDASITGLCHVKCTPIRKAANGTKICSTNTSSLFN